MEKLDEQEMEAETQGGRRRYEPHLIEADDKGQIRGIFRMNPKDDPACKIIEEPKSVRRQESN